GFVRWPALMARRSFAAQVHPHDQSAAVTRPAAERIDRTAGPVPRAHDDPPNRTVHTCLPSSPLTKWSKYGLFQGERESREILARNRVQRSNPRGAVSRRLVR